MANRWVVNASPIISLVKIDRIHLLSELCDEVIIPQGVRDEVTLGGYADSAVNWLQQAGQQFIQPAPAINSRIASWDLGLGESQVLSWAMTDPEYEAILDDLAARKAAKILKIPVRGTLAIILLAKQMGCIASVKQDFEKLMQVGLRISPTILAQAIALAEEQ